MTNTPMLSDDEWNAVQEDLNEHFNVLYNHYRTSKHGEIVKDGNKIVVFADGAGEELYECAKRVNVDHAALRQVMIKKARQWTDYDWGESDPVFIEYEEGR